MAAAQKTLVIRNGTLIDGSGQATARNDAIVIEGNRIKSVGPLPPDVRLEDRSKVEVLDAGGQWIMPGLIDAHCHMSYGYPAVKGEGKGKGTTRPEFSTLKSARSAQKVLRSGVTSISVPGGTWFTDVGVRDAIRLGLMDGPRMFTAGRMIITYGCIEDDEPSWEGTPDHAIGKLCNTADEMVTEVRRQHKHGVNFIKMADSRSGDSQMLSKDEIAAVVAEAHRRNLPVAIHSRGAGSTRAAAEGGVDWIMHADLATDADLEAVAKAGTAILPTATFLGQVVELGSKVGPEQVQLDYQPHEAALRPAVRDHPEGAQARHQAPGRHRYRQQHLHDPRRLHAKELEIFVKYGGYSPMQAIVAATRATPWRSGWTARSARSRPYSPAGHARGAASSSTPATRRTCSGAAPRKGPPKQEPRTLWTPTRFAASPSPGATTRRMRTRPTTVKPAAGASISRTIRERIRMPFLSGPATTLSSIEATGSTQL